MTAKDWIGRHDLQPHPEGGYYARTYCSPDAFPGSAATDPFPAGRPWSTAILYLMESGDFAGFHRIKSDELWHFHEGGAVEIYLLLGPDQLQVIRLGPGFAQQAAIPANHWFAAAPAAGTTFALVGCTVCPGFLFQDHEMAVAADLSTEFPAQSALIHRFCRA